MLYESRFQFIYFFFSGLVASAILILLYISVQDECNDQLKEKLKAIQTSLNFIKPTTSWCYNNTWQFIGDPSMRHQVYSAYFDVRTDVFEKVEYDETLVLYGSLRIFAILPLRLRGQISCIIRFADFSTGEVKATEAVPIHDHFDMKFSAYTIMCPLKVRRLQKDVHLPQSVGITYTANLWSHLSPSYVPISYPKDMTRLLAKTQPSLAVCVGPLQQNYSEVLRLVEFIEIYRILGADKFYIYRQNTSGEVLAALEHYRGMNIVEILDWNLHGNEFEKELHDSGVLAQLNECAFRAGIVEGYRYAAVVALDEILVPLRHNSLMEYLRQIDEGRTSAFIFRNVFYFKKDSNDLFTVPPHVRNRFLYTQVKVRRTLEIQPVHIRSKYIVNTRSVIELGHHQTWSSLAGYTETLVHMNTGLLFQYRDKCIGCKAILITDYAARRFGSLLWDRVDEECWEIFGDRDGICPLE